MSDGWRAAIYGGLSGLSFMAIVTGVMELPLALLFDRPTVPIVVGQLVVGVADFF